MSIAEYFFAADAIIAALVALLYFTFRAWCLFISRKSRKGRKAANVPYGNQLRDEELAS